MTSPVSDPSTRRAPVTGRIRARLERSSLGASAAAVILTGVVAYARTLDVPWYLDDLRGIVENPAVRDPSGAVAGLLAPRGLTNLTFALNFAACGYALPCFHATNLAIHLAAGVVALLVLRRTFPDRPLLAALGALFFVAHPLQTQAVTYVVQRLANLAALLCLLATYLYLVARDALESGASVRSARFVVPYAAAVISGAAAVLAKENAAILPALLAVCDRLVPGLPPPRSRWRTVVLIAPFAVVPAVTALRAVGVAFLLPSAGPVAAAPFDADVVGDPAAVTRIAYLATEVEVIWRYLRLLVWPFGQVLDAGLAVSPDPLRPGAILAAGGLVALVAGALLVRRKAPPVALGVLWFLAALAVESSIIPLDPYFEHRLYLPMLGASILFAWTLGRAPRDSLAAGVVGLSLVAALAALTWRRNAEWREPERLWAADLAAGSASYRSATGLADAYHRRGDEDRARRAYEVLVSRGAERCRTGGCGATYLYNVGVGAERLGDLDSAARLYGLALERSPAYAPARFGLGVVAYRSGRKEEALSHFRDALQLAPGDVDALFNVATVALELGDRAPAEANLAAIRRLSPDRGAELERALAAALPR